MSHIGMPGFRRDQDPRLRQLADEQAALRRVATLVARGTSPAEMFSVVSNEVGQLFGSRQAAIGRYEPDGSSVVYVGISEGLSVMPIGTRWPLEEFLASTTVYRTGRPARQEQNDYETAPGHVADTLRELNTVSRVGAPIFVEGKLWGVLLVTDTHQSLPPDTEERLAKFTELVATAIANAESRAELAASETRAHDLAREQIALRRVATLVAEGTSADELFSAVSNEVGELFGAEAAVARFESDESSMVVVGLTRGIPIVSIGTRWPLEDYLASTVVYRTGRPARNDHTGHENASGQVADSLRQMNFVSTVAAPITVEGNLWGVMTVSDERKPLPPDAEQRVAKFTELVGTAIANAESRAELAAAEARAYELALEQAALRRVATLVAQDAPSGDLCGAVAREVGRLFGADFAAIIRYEPDPSFVTTMAFWAATGEHPPAPSRPRTVRGDPPSMLADRGKPSRVEDWSTVQGPIAEFIHGQLGVKSSVGCPILVEGRMWGGLAIHSKGEPFPPETEVRLLKFTELVATAIANADARAEVARLADEQAALRRVATLVARGASPAEVFDIVNREVGQLFGSNRTAVARFDPDGSGMVVVALGRALPGVSIGTRWPLEDYLASTAVYRTGRPARSDHAGHLEASGPVAASLRAAGSLSTVATPIVVEGKLWGVLTMSDDEQPFPPDTEERVAKFTELVATAIANAESRSALAASEERTRELAREQAALRRVATLVARGVSPEEVFSVVTDEVGQLFDCDLVMVGRYEPDGSGVVWVGVTPGRDRVPSGSRWPLEDYLVATAVYRTGRPARRDLDDYQPVSGPLAHIVRELNLVSRVGAPIVVEGKLWGLIAVNDGRGPLPPDTEERVAKFTELVATAIANAEGRAELTASRARVVAAADDARQRIERDLHDGAQQRLVTLAVALQRAQSKVPPGSDELRADVSRVAEGLITAVNELRELSQGIHPAELTEGGLSPALKALGRRSAIRVELDMRFEQRLPDQLEVAAYYTVSEALTNASKHANATRVRVCLGIENDVLHLSIRDDGTGGADPSRGSGLTGLRDRIEALYGSIQIDSPPGRGTHIEVEFPIHASSDEGSEPNESASPITARDSAR